MHIKVRISIPPAMWTPWNANLRGPELGVAARPKHLKVNAAYDPDGKHPMLSHQQVDHSGDTGFIVNLV